MYILQKVTRRLCIKYFIFFAVVKVGERRVTVNSDVIALLLLEEKVKIQTRQKNSVSRNFEFQNFLKKM